MVFSETAQAFLAGADIVYSCSAEPAGGLRPEFGGSAVYLYVVLSRTENIWRGS